MSVLLQIRNVPEETRRELKARASSQGISLNSYLLNILDRETARPAVATVLERARQRSERATASSVEALEHERSRRHELPERSQTT